METVMNEADEKAWLEYESKAVKEGKLQTGWDTNKDSYIAGRASRDSELEVLREEIKRRDQLFDEVIEAMELSEESAKRMKENRPLIWRYQALSKGDPNAG